MSDANVIAIPYQHTDEAKFEYLLDQCCQHRPWFDDWAWEDKFERRKIVIGHIAKATTSGFVFEVWSGAKLVGLIILNEVAYRTDCRCHFIFFDRRLKDKQQLCLNAMRWAFDKWDLHALRVEIPTYARALAKFARKRLGFRYEAEARHFTWPRDARPLSEREAELGSRRHQATRYKGEWHDVLLLSVTRKEFDGRTLQATNDGDHLSGDRTTAARIVESDSADHGKSTGSRESV